MMANRWQFCLVGDMISIPVSVNEKDALSHDRCVSPASDLDLRASRVL